MATSRPWTKEEFASWLNEKTVSDIYVRPFEIIGCTCKDVNCKGWRLVTPAQTAVERQRPEARN